MLEKAIPIIGGKTITADLFTAQPSPTNNTGQLLKVNRIFFNSESTEDKLQQVNIDVGVRIFLSRK